MKVVWTNPALDDLSEIGYFIAQGSPTRAHSFVAELFDQAEKLVDFPQSGRKFPGTRREDLRELIYVIRAGAMSGIRRLGWDIQVIEDFGDDLGFKDGGHRFE